METGRCSIEILQLVDQLEEVLNNGWRLPVGSSLVVNGEECLRLIDQMRISVPSAIKEGERMLAERDRILGEARAEAQRLQEESRQRAQNLVTEESIVAMAQSEADRILEEGAVNAERMVHEAENYVLHLLSQLADDLNGALRQVENGIGAVQSQMQQDAASQNGRLPEDEEEFLTEEEM